MRTEITRARGTYTSELHDRKNRLRLQKKIFLTPTPTPSKKFFGLRLRLRRVFFSRLRLREIFFSRLRSSLTYTFQFTFSNKSRFSLYFMVVVENISSQLPIVDPSRGLRVRILIHQIRTLVWSSETIQPVKIVLSI